MLRFALLLCSSLAGGCQNSMAPQAPVASTARQATARRSTPTALAAAHGSVQTPPTRTGERQATSPAAVVAPGTEVVFRGMCDASGAIPIDTRRFAVADDEDNLIRIYDAELGGTPLAISAIEGLEDNGQELDLEGAARVSDYGLWIASHGRGKDGTRLMTRINLFLSTAPDPDRPLKLVGKPYRALLSVLAAEPRLQRFHLKQAAEIAPSQPGGLNIEGLTARPDGGILIGFRSPVPRGHALIVGLSNPVEVARDAAPPVFDVVRQFDLGEGRGIRALSQWHGRYLMIGGSPTYTTTSQLYTWDGHSKDASLVALDLSAYNPEAFFTPEGRDLFMVLSDDGEVDHHGTPCKYLRDTGRKQFRGLWTSLPTPP